MSNTDNEAGSGLCWQTKSQKNCSLLIEQNHLHHPQNCLWESLACAPGENLKILNLKRKKKNLVMLQAIIFDEQKFSR